MKELFFFFSACLLFSFTASAQCAIYICDQTGVWAASYYDGNPPYRNMEETRQEAYDVCVQNGGQNCRFFWATECRSCWVAFIISDDGRTLNYAVETSDINQEYTEYKVRELYRKNNGVNYLGAKVTSWYLPK